MGITKLFVGGLAWATTDQTLRSAFEEVGEVESARVVRDRDSGKSRGFGFVEYKTDEVAEEAVKKLNGTELDGRNIKVDFSNGEGDRGGDRGGGRDNRRDAPYSRDRGFRSNDRNSGYDRNYDRHDRRDRDRDRGGRNDRGSRNDHSKKILNEFKFNSVITKLVISMV